MRSAVLEGRGLRTGALARVRLVREEGAVRVRAAGIERAIDALSFDGSTRSTAATSSDGAFRLGTVEHLFAALGAAGIHEGVLVEVEGEELPLLDGAARAFADALATLSVQPSSPRLVVARAGTVDVGDARYALAPPSRAGERVVEVDVDWGDPRLERAARWEGDPEDFRDRVASARTFGFAHELEALLGRGLPSHVTPESVVVIDTDAVHCAGRAFASDEPARHKLLDLIGDLYAHGGPPVGVVRASRPGHAATHDAVRRALAEGLLRRV